MRAFLPILLCAVLSAAGCSSPEKHRAKVEKEMAQANTRRIEEMRMRTITNGDAGSQRGAEVIQYDPGKAFDPSRSGIGTLRPYHANGVPTKEFNSRSARVKAYEARDFRHAKSAPSGDKKFGTREAGTRAYATKEAATKTAASREAWDANKTAASRESLDGRRPYLGPESKNLSKSMDPKELANWRNSSETVVYSDGVVEKVSTFKQLSIDDVKELLNKNK